MYCFVVSLCSHSISDQIFELTMGKDWNIVRTYLFRLESFKVLQYNVIYFAWSAV